MLKNITGRPRRICPRLKTLFLRLAAIFTREAAREAASFMYGSAVMFLSAQAALHGHLSPFAPALFAAGLAAEISPVSMLIGCTAAIPIGPFSPEALMPLLGCLTTYGVSLVVRLVFDQAPGDPDGRDFRMAATASIGALLPGLIMAKGLFYNILGACASAVIACATAPCMYTALLIRADRQRLLPDERLSIALHMAVMMLGSAYLPGPLRYSPIALAALFSLFYARSGAGWGSLGALGCSLVARLCGFDPLFCALLPLPGALAGAFSPFSRYGSALAMFFGVTLISLWTLGMEKTLPYSVCALTAAVVFCAVPEQVRTLLSIPADAAREDEARALARQKDDLRRDMRALSDVFADLAASYVHSGPAMPSESEMVAHLRERLCENCPSYSSCWSGGNGTAYRLLCQLLGLAFSGATPGEETELPAEIGRQCRRAAQISRRVGALLSSFEMRRRTEIKRARLTALMSAQFEQARALLQRAGELIGTGGQIDPALAMIGRSALEKEGLRAEYVYAIGGQTPEICARLAYMRNSDAALRRAAHSIGTETGTHYTYTAGPQNEVHFTPQPRWQIKTGWRSVPGHKDCPNGDSRIATRLADGRLLLALSDGMGSGTRAGQESAETLRLITRFLRSGMEPCAAIDAINELMLLRSGEDMFSTVDLCLVDSSGSSAEFIKLGACRSYLMRAGAIVRLEGGRLPLGILEEVRPVRRSVPLSKGDLLVMATDGFESGDDDEWIVQILRTVSAQPPQTICDTLMHAALSRPRAHIDDTTVLVFRVC